VSSFVQHLKVIGFQDRVWYFYDPRDGVLYVRDLKFVFDKSGHFCHPMSLLHYSIR